MLSNQKKQGLLKGMITYCLLPPDQDNTKAIIQKINQRKKQQQQKVQNINQLIITVTFKDKSQQKNNQIQNQLKQIQLNKLFFDACNEDYTLSLQLKFKYKSQPKSIGICQFPLKKLFYYHEYKHTLQLDIIDKDKFLTQKQAKKWARLKLQAFCYVLKPNQYGQLTIHKAVFNPIQTKTIYNKDNDLEACLQIYLGDQHYTLQSYKIAGGKVVWNTTLTLKIYSISTNFRATVVDSWNNYVLGSCKLYIPDFFMPSDKIRTIQVQMQKDGKVGTLEISSHLKLIQE